MEILMKTENAMLLEDLEKKGFSYEMVDWNNEEAMKLSLREGTVPRMVHPDYVKEILLDAGYEECQFEIVAIDRNVYVKAVIG